jgi:hypothetical protein
MIAQHLSVAARIKLVPEEFILRKRQHVFRSVVITRNASKKAQKIKPLRGNKKPVSINGPFRTGHMRISHQEDNDRHIYTQRSMIKRLSFLQGQIKKTMACQWMLTIMKYRYTSENDKN